MKDLYLSPSEIRYSQDSINNVFDNRSNYRHAYIGETLDDLCEGRRQVEDIPTISVVRKDGHWFTLDNRRLWVFRHLERLRKCTEIPVKQSVFIPEEKFTTDNNGKTVEVRGNPGGSWYKKNTPPKNQSRIQSTAAKDVCITMEEPEVPVAAINRQTVPVRTRQIPKDVHKSKKDRCLCVIL